MARHMVWLLFPRVLAGILIIAALITLFSLSASATHIAGTPQFQPVIEVKLCNDLVAGFNAPPPISGGGGGTCTPDTTPGGNPDATVAINVPAGHMNLTADYVIYALADFVVAADAAIPDGTAAGGLGSDITLGLAANPCKPPGISPQFLLWESEAADNITNEIATSPEGTSDRWNTDEPPGPPNTDVITDGGLDPDGVNRSGQADADSPIVTGYPDFLNKFFDPDGDGIDTDTNPATKGDQPVTPHARYAGATQVPPGGDFQLFQNIVFAPGDLKAAFAANEDTGTHPFAKLDAGMGYVNVVVLNDPGATAGSISAISDFCSPLSVDGMLLGKVDTTGNGVGDTVRLTAPAAGGYGAQVRTQSQRDNDGDGIENSFDTCPYAANTEDPYLSNGPDSDSFDSVCDPTPAGDTNAGDHDGDLFINNQDACPADFVASPAAQLDSERDETRDATAGDGGPKGDSIGDACDTDDVISDGVYFNTIYVDSVCLTADPATDDTDSDGWCEGSGLGTDIDDTVADDTGGTYSMIPDTTNPDGGVSPNETYDAETEWGIGTDPMSACSLIGGHDAWPADFDTNTVINVTDVFNVLPPTFGSSAPGGPPYTARADLAPDDVINVTDVFGVLPPIFGSSCSVAGQ